MSDTGAAVRKAKNDAENKTRKAVSSKGGQGLVRLGYIVRGVLYGLVGVLALQVALGRGGENTDKNGAIEKIGQEPFGHYLLILVTVGLIGYSLWGFVRAFLDPLGKGSDAKGMAQRAGYVVSGLTYGALVIPTFRAAIGSNQAQQGGSANQEMTAWLMHQPFGPWLVGLIGLISMVGGFGQIYQGIKTDFKKDFKSEEMSPTEMEWAVRVGRFGMAARGVIFAMLGFFLIQAALHVDPKQAKGLDGALATLAAQPFGPWLLGLVALGLVSFGVYSVLCGRWIRVGSGQGSRSKGT